MSLPILRPIGASPRACLRSTRSSSKFRSVCSSTPLPALKEWAPAVSALRAGDQTVLLRKGGIKEPTFTPRSPAFILFPTAFHTDAALLRPEAQTRYAAECAFDPRNDPILSFSVIAEVTGAWATTDPSVLAALAPLHIYGDGFLDARLRWRPTQPLTVLELRARALAVPLTVATQEDFWGCFSWVDLPGEGLQSLDSLLEAGTPALSDAAFAEKQATCRSALATLNDLIELPLPSVQP
jgi:hypothetical protein